MAHSIDLHAANVNPAAACLDALPGRSHAIRFVAEFPDVFMHRCETMPMLLHVAKGMYGEGIVLPKGPRRPAFDLVQSAFYTSMQSLLNGFPSVVACNGEADRYVARRLHAAAGRAVRFAVVNAGPNEWSALHVVCPILRAVRPSGGPTVLCDVQTYSVPPGDGALITVVFPVPGVYALVTHAMRDMAKGAMAEVVAGRASRSRVGAPA